MSSKKKSYLTVLLAALFLFGFFLWCLIKPDTDISTSERRPLAKMPVFSAQTLLNGKFMEDFEAYTTDQFPLREEFRSLKAIANFYAFGQRDMGGVFVEDGVLSKLETPLNFKSITHAAEKFRLIQEQYLNDSNAVYLSIIPDKNYFMSKNYPSLDYDALVSQLRSQTSFAAYIDLFPLLELSDYYKTDTHWRQERIVDVAQKLGGEMGTPLSAQYREVLLDQPFYGVYHGQAALPLPPEELYYLENSLFKDCTVYDFETQQEIPLYDFEKGHGQDPYELFLSGSKSLLTIQNPNATTDKRLILFRDSFGASIAPLLMEGYREITLVDIRYISSGVLGNFISFENSDVLFLYSTLVLNHSVTLK